MKDKSKLLSSVIVSLLAGFIYYYVGEDIQHKLETSFKAVLSQNEIKPDFIQKGSDFNFIVKGKNNFAKKNKSVFFIESDKNSVNLIQEPNKTIETNFSENSVSVNSEVLIPIPDKNIDFTAELNNLINSNQNDNHIFRIEIKTDNRNYKSEVADVCRSDFETRVNFGISGKEDLSFKPEEFRDKCNNGFGFEYNNTSEENYEINSNSIQSEKVECPESISIFYFNYQKKNNLSETKDRKDKTRFNNTTGEIKSKNSSEPEINFYFYEEYREQKKNHIPEINLEEYELDNDSM